MLLKNLLFGMTHFFAIHHVGRNWFSVISSKHTLPEWNCRGSSFRWLFFSILQVYYTELRGGTRSTQRKQIITIGGRCFWFIRSYWWYDFFFLKYSKTFWDIAKHFKTTLFSCNTGKHFSSILIFKYTTGICDPNKILFSSFSNKTFAFLAKFTFLDITFNVIIKLSFCLQTWILVQRFT